MLRCVLIVLLLGLGGARGDAQPAAPPQGQDDAKRLAGTGAVPTGRKPSGRLAGVRSWGYQLQNVDPAAIANSPFDLVVVDFSKDGTEAARFTPEDIRAMQRKPDGSRRHVLAYMSIGEAEEYRFYWDDKWVEAAPLMPVVGPPAGVASTPPAAAVAIGQPKTVRIPRLFAPSWLGRENPRWPGNFLVRYWYDDWQNLIMHHSDSYLSRVIAAGFDGAYLDRIDAFYETKLDTRFAIEKMVDFVVEFAEIARQRKAGFVIVPQNAEELLKEPRYLAAIDGVAKEDLAFGLNDDGKPNDLDKIARGADKLRIARDAGLPVLVVEYLSEAEQMTVADTLLGSFGFVPYFAPRKLDALVVRAKP